MCHEWVTQDRYESNALFSHQATGIAKCYVPPVEVEAEEMQDDQEEGSSCVEGHNYTNLMKALKALSHQVADQNLDHDQQEKVLEYCRGLQNAFRSESDVTEP